jgi:DNA-binding NtrC family response regulator
VRVTLIRVLLVEDDAVLGRAMWRALERDMAIVGVVTSVTAAVEMLLNTPVDVVVTDYDLGERLIGLTGLDLASYIQETRPEIGVILATGSINERIRERALESGVHVCLEKPVDIARMRLEIRNAASAARKS